MLTTHHMGEAQKLGDRIGIMMQGRLACLGTSQHLLSKYSSGYTVGVSVRDGQSVNTAAVPLIKKMVPKAKLKEKAGELYCYYDLGTEHFSVAEMYAQLDALKREGEIDSFDLGQASLEKVFLQLQGKVENRLTSAERDADDQNAAAMDAVVDLEG